MEDEDIIEMVTQPTEWCAAMLPVLKPNERGLAMRRPQVIE